MDPELIAAYDNTFVNIIDSCLGIYYRSLRIRLSQMFRDTNCLYRSLSHIIFGTEKHYDLKSKLITKFRNNPEHTLNVTHMSGIMSEEELDDHFKLINIPNEWDTNVKLAILGALAHLDIIVIDANNNDHQFWTVGTIYVVHNIVLTLSLHDQIVLHNDMMTNRNFSNGYTVEFG